MTSILSRAADSLRSFFKYSPAARVYTLRLLSSNAVTLGLMIYFDLAPNPHYVRYWTNIVDRDHWVERWLGRLTVISAWHLLILVHHPSVVLVAFANVRESYSRVIGVVDIALTVLEFALLFIFQIFVFQITSNADDRVDLVYLLGYMPFLYAGFNTIVVICLAFSLAFRLASAVRSRWDFFGGCTSAKYNIPTIFMNRSVTRPLIRGESPFIIAPRALVINLVVIGVAGFAVYSIIATSNQVVLDGELRYMMVNYYQALRSVAQITQENTLLAQPLPLGETNYSSSFIRVFTTVTTLEGYEEHDCGSMLLNRPYGWETSCSFGWNELASLEFRAAIPNTGVPAVMAALDFTIMPWSTRRSYLSNAEILSPPIRAARNSAESVFLGANTTIRATMGWIERELKSTKRETVYIPQFMTKQTEVIPGSDSRFIIVNLQPPRIIRTEAEFSDASVLDGITSVGGFWTFVDGIFAVLFGANVLYFALGSRPLSALGLVHVFQRNQIVRNWNQDSPALRTEGGSPGSESAGVVAFLRERLVDIEAVSVPSDGIAAEPRPNDLESGATSPKKDAEETSLGEQDKASVPLLHEQAGDDIALNDLRSQAHV